MEIARTVEQLRELRGALARRRWSALGHRPVVGLVPTMGGLHAGHSSLLERMAAECDVRLASVFVNPRQFNEEQDFELYPRDLEKDMELCRECGVDVLFAPEQSELYPSGFQTTVHAGRLARKWEGEAREGHFDGVITIVGKLLNIARPDRAYFGEKDYQQLRVVERLVADFDYETHIVPCPIVREPDGLAMSSRNARLSPDDRRYAGHLCEALREVTQAFFAGERDCQQLLARGGRVLEGWTQDGLIVDYFQIVDPESLEARESAHAGDRVIIAATLHGTRLIDNMLLVPGGAEI